MPAEHIAGEERLSAGVERHCAVFFAFVHPLFHELLRLTKGVLVNDLEFRDDLRSAFPTPQNSGIGDVVQDVTHRRLMPVFAGACFHALRAYEIGDFIAVISQPMQKLNIMRMTLASSSLISSLLISCLRLLKVPLGFGR